MSLNSTKIPGMFVSAIHLKLFIAVVGHNFNRIKLSFYLFRLVTHAARVAINTADANAANQFTCIPIREVNIT